MGTFCIEAKPGLPHPPRSLGSECQHERIRKEGELGCKVGGRAGSLDPKGVLAARDLGRAEDGIGEPGPGELRLETIAGPEGVEDLPEVSMERGGSADPLEPASLHGLVKDAKRVPDHLCGAAAIAGPVRRIAGLGRDDHEPDLVQSPDRPAKGAGYEAGRRIPYARAFAGTGEVRAGRVGRDNEVEKGRSERVRNVFHADTVVRQVGEEQFHGAVAGGIFKLRTSPRQLINLCEEQAGMWLGPDRISFEAPGRSPATCSFNCTSNSSDAVRRLRILQKVQLRTEIASELKQSA